MFTLWILDVSSDPALRDDRQKCDKENPGKIQP